MLDVTELMLEEYADVTLIIRFAANNTLLIIDTAPVLESISFVDEDTLYFPDVIMFELILDSFLSLICIPLCIGTKPPGILDCN